MYFKKLQTTFLKLFYLTACPKFDQILIPSSKDIPALKRKKYIYLMHVDHALHVHAHDKTSIQYDFRV